MGTAVPTADYRDVVVETYPETAVEFLQAWHGSLPDDVGVTTLFSLPSRAALHLPAREMIERIETDGLNGLVYPPKNGAQNVYHGNALLREAPARGRGRVKDIGVAPGFWLDADVKEKAFSSQKQIREFVWGPMESAGLKPSILVNSGTGCHLYWLTEEPLAPKEMRELGTRIWLWMQNAAGVELDNLAEPARVFRLPGTVWVSKGEGGASGSPNKPVTMQWCRPEATMPAERIRDLTQPAWEEWERKQKKAWLERKKADKEAEKRWAASLSLYGKTASMRDLAIIEMARQEFPLRVSWEEILEPKGWTKYGNADDEGHQMWTRPHDPGEKLNPRSLVTDWDGSPNVASLLSDNEPVLGKLKSDGIALSKLNVFAALYFNGSVLDALMAFIEDEQESGHGF